MLYFHTWYFGEKRGIKFSFVFLLKLSSFNIANTIVMSKSKNDKYEKVIVSVAIRWFRDWHDDRTGAADSNLLRL